mmetsp:Transcript_57509/g.136820  ORF Transcript_57509/g.136820 Transcript_57509/m.136820 type:complete len:618 (-) Transcript_57509:71-1924(-)|eukprot:CAMPEP_0178440060 /NCGR_PEP_ID=MMETSP0689_2-20121128/36536_1 /TAXON_ID=160604 /ORGANISM="Amphidinium massartii, Strain CS-259" /LENGTH=617 /DNA_ID=CAMNT_0020062727 /DNA_START=163 /DNA_END=2016 /DNA_ORIENTATION=-
MKASEFQEPAEDFTSDDEGADGYRRGGYHVVTVGEVYNQRYRVIAKLGWGHFSTVWLCHDVEYSRFVAMKVQKSAPHYTEAAYDEIELLAEVAKRGSAREWEATQNGPLGHLFPCVPFTGVVQLLDYFEHYGANGKHVCMVFETMGPNVLALIKRYNFKGVPLHIVRKVATHTLIGLDYLHRVCGIIHTDLKPENVLVGCPQGVPVNKHGVPLIGDVDQETAQSKRDYMAQTFLNKDHVNKADKKPKQNKTKTTNKNHTTATTHNNNNHNHKLNKVAAAASNASGPPYMKPSLKPSRSDPSMLSSYGDDSYLITKPLYNHKSACINGAVGRSNDGMMSVAGVPGDWFPSQDVLEQVCNLDLFDHPGVTYKVADLGNACWVSKHFSDEIQTRQYRSPETIINANYDTSADTWSCACMIFELVTGDYLFDPKASEEYPRDEDHLALFSELLGTMPPELVSRGRRSVTYYNRRSELRHIKVLRYWSLADVLTDKYHMHPVEATNLASFLLPMLRLLPEARAPPQQLLAHPWLQGLPAPEALEQANRSALNSLQPHHMPGSIAQQLAGSNAREVEAAAAALGMTTNGMLREDNDDDDAEDSEDEESEDEEGDTEVDCEEER